MEIIQQEGEQKNIPLQEGENEKNIYKGEINLYPIFRRVFIILCILVVVGLMALLIYQNGKSIYDNGL